MMANGTPRRRTVNSGWPERMSGDISNGAIASAAGTAAIISRLGYPRLMMLPNDLAAQPRAANCTPRTQKTGARRSAAAAAGYASSGWILLKPQSWHLNRKLSDIDL